MQDCIPQWGPIKASLGTPHVAIEYRSILLAFARLFGAHIPKLFLVSFSTSLLVLHRSPSNLLTEHLLVGYPRSHFCYPRLAAGEEACPTKEGPWQGRPGLSSAFFLALFPRLAIGLSSLHMFSCHPPRAINAHLGLKNSIQTLQGRDLSTRL